MMGDAIANGLDSKDADLLRAWRLDPINWGAKHGFPKVEKK